MKFARWIVWTFVLSVGFAIVARGQVVFFADFEPNSKAAIPDSSVNDLKNWKINAPGQILQVTDHPTNGTQALKITVEGCGNSGSFDLPGVKKFTDGMIQLEMNPGDDDSFGVIFRRSADNEGYLVTFGVIETPSVIVAGLDKCGAEGQCLSDMGCENNAGNTIAEVPHGMVIGQNNESDMLGRIVVDGDSIRVWYVPLADVADPMAEDLGVPPLVEVTDSSFKGPGKVALWHESMSNGFFDNVLVTGPAFLAVDPKHKLATTWGILKRDTER